MTTPNNRKPGRRMVKVGALTYAQLVKHMIEGTYTCYELAELTGLHYVTVLQYARELHRAKAAHISSWGLDAHGRDALKVYKIGPGRDAPRTRMSRNEIARRYRAKIKARETLHRMAGRLEVAA